jgi:hypothetical protein
LETVKWPLRRGETVYGRATLKWAQTSGIRIPTRIVRRTP